MLVAPSPASAVTTCSGVDIAVGQSIQAAINARTQATTFCLAAGTHRVTAPVALKSGTRLVGRPGAVINGSSLVTNWVKSGSSWVASGQTQGPVMVPWSTSSLLNRGSIYADALFFDDVAVRRVMSLTALAPGVFFFDYGADKIYLGSDPTGHKVEAAVSTGGVKGGSNAVIEGLVVEKTAGIGIDGEGTTGQVVRDNEVRLNHRIGIRQRAGGKALRNNVHHNGQYGITGSGSGVVAEGNEIAYNNAARFYAAADENWDSGGTKWVKTSGIIVRNNYSHHNWGDGLWLDIDNINATIENNRVERNERAGIFYEISYAATIRNNTLMGNGFLMSNGQPSKSWGAAGIFVNASPDVAIYGNTLTGNRRGIFLQQGNRGLGAYGPRITRNADVHNNTVTMCTGMTGASGNTAIYDPARNNRFHSNDYVAPLSGKFWYWDSNYRTWNEWRNYGNDTQGTLTTAAC